RRLWAEIVRDRFGARDPRSWTLRLFSGGDGTSLTSVEPLNNIVRVALQALAIVLSGAQAVHTISWDEALGLPAEEAVTLALRTQQVIAHETGVARTVDPLGGSYYVEALTDELHRRAASLLAEVEEHGVLRGIADGSIESAIADAAYRQEQAIASGERVVVGVNRFRDDRAAAEDVRPFKVGPETLERQLARLSKVREGRDAAAVRRSLAAVETAAASEENTMPVILEAVRSYATVGEISDALGRVFGRHRPSTVV
ncbi:MAG TPA: methylmalonyl-CoA mutase family protein, partial [Gaiellaceae bacterium]|nr:methylmalonyl-CoA mutase family protein [Gaiellaceae bacterium]